MNVWTDECEGVKKRVEVFKQFHIMYANDAYIYDFGKITKIDGRAPNAAGVSERGKKWIKSQKDYFSVEHLGFFSSSSYKRIFSIVVFHFFVGFGLNGVFNSSKKEIQRGTKSTTTKTVAARKKGDLTSLYT